MHGLHRKALESMKIQLSGLCPLGPLKASWAGPSSLLLWLMHPAQYTLFSVSKCQCGRRSRLWSGHQCYKVSPLNSWLFCSLFPSCSCYYPEFINNMTLLLSLLPYMQPSLMLNSLCWQVLTGFCSPDQILIETETKGIWGLWHAILWKHPKNRTHWLMHTGEAGQLGRGKLGKEMLAELGFEWNVSELIIILSLRGTEKLEAKGNRIGDSTGRGHVLPRSKRRWGAKYEGVNKEALFRGGKRSSWRG